MLKKELIIKLVGDYILENESIFLVDVKLSSSNQIEVLIDSFDGISIKNCIYLSRYIESALDRDECDFSLQVASAGLSEPFKVFQQYKKSIGRDVNVYLKGGKELLGKIVDANEGEGITLETIIKKKQGKKKTQIIEQQSLSFEQIDKTKVVISF
jgi:ribosome maturation factor RimP